VLVELGLVEQRYQAVREVLEGASVTDVARRNGVARHDLDPLSWTRGFGSQGLKVAANSAGVM
jgi:transposase-like protein